MVEIFDSDPFPNRCTHIDSIAIVKLNHWQNLSLSFYFKSFVFGDMDSFEFEYFIKDFREFIIYQIILVQLIAP